MDGPTNRTEEFLDTIPQLTANTLIGELFDLEFQYDPQVSSWARRELGVKLWSQRGGQGGKRAVRRNNTMVRLGDEGFWAIMDVTDLDTMTEENIRNIRGNRRTVRDLRKLREAMVAFPNVPLLEAARLAMVSLEVIRLPRQKSG